MNLFKNNVSVISAVFADFSTRLNKLRDEHAATVAGFDAAKDKKEKAFAAQNKILRGFDRGQSFDFLGREYAARDIVYGEVTITEPPKFKALLRFGGRWNLNTKDRATAGEDIVIDVTAPVLNIDANVVELMTRTDWNIVVDSDAEVYDKEPSMSVVFRASPDSDLGEAKFQGEDIHLLACVNN